MALIGFLCDIIYFVWKVIGRVVCLLIKFITMLLSFLMLVSVLSILLSLLGNGLESLGYPSLNNYISRYVIIKYDCNSYDNKIKLDYNIGIENKGILVNFAYDIGYIKKEEIMIDKDTNNVDSIDIVNEVEDTTTTINSNDIKEDIDIDD